MPREMATQTGKAIAEKPFERLLRQMENLAELDRDSGAGNVSAVNTVNAILSAETEQEMWDADEMAQVNGKTLVGLEMTIHDFQVKFGDNEDIESVFIAPESNRHMYLLVECSRLSASRVCPQYAVGDTIIWNTSAPSLVAKLFWMRTHNKLPGAEAVIQETPLGGGKGVLKLKELPKRPVQAKTA